MTIKRHWLRRTHAGSLALATMLMTTACGKEEPKPQPAATAPGTQAATTAPSPTTAPPKGPENDQPRRDPEMKAAAPSAGTGVFAAPVLGMLPKDTFGLFIGTPQKVYDALGVERIMGMYAERTQEMVAEMEGRFGKNLFDLAAWKSIGVDLSGPAGIASLDPRRELVALFLTLADSAAFRTFLDAMAKKMEATPNEEKVGDATILTLGERDRGALVLKGNLAIFIGLDRGTGAAAVAKELVGMAPEASLAMNDSFKKAVGGLANDEAGAYADLGLVAQMMTMDSGGGDSPRRVAERDLVKMMFDGISGIGVGIDLTSDSAEATFRLPIADGSPLKKLLANTSGVFPVVKVTKDQPLFVAAAKIDLPGYMAIVDKAMRAEGEDLGEMKSQLKDFTGIDFDKDVLGLFTGEVGIAVTGDPKTMLSGDAPWNQLSGGVTVGLANPDGMKAMLGRIAGIEQLSRMLRWDAATGVLTVPLPIEKTLTVQVAGSHLVVTVDPEFAARVASGDGASSFVAGLQNGRLKDLLGKADQAGIFLMPQTLGAGWMLAMRGSYDVPRPFPPTDPALQGKYDEYMKLRKELDDLRQAREQKKMETMMAAMEKIGHTAETFQMAADGVTGTFGQYLRGATIPDVLADLVTLSRSRGEERDEAERAKYEQMWKLESELLRPTIDHAEPVKEEAPKTP